MMIGTILSNFWGALVFFSLYFFVMFQKTESPLRILIGSFICAIIGFAIMYIIRFLIGYIFYTPKESNVETNINENMNEQLNVDQKPTQDKASKSDRSESSEEIAQVIRTMMNS